MNAASVLPLFLIGLLGSVHCVGMCGGIVSAMSISSTARRPFAIGTVAAGAARLRLAPPMPGAVDQAQRVVSYNAGRIGSYMVAGAMAGGLFGGVRTLTGLFWVQGAAYWIANLMLIVLGLYLTGAWNGLRRLESIGKSLWRHLQPLVRNVLPIDTVGKAFVAGSLWGWVPCGMVYSVLLTAALSGSAAGGAIVMLAFGLGTLPVLLSLGMAGSVLQRWLQRRAVRTAAGVLVVAFGLLGLVRATASVPPGWLDAICITSDAGMTQ